MKFSKNAKIVLSLALSLSLYAEDNFNIEKQKLEDAIKQIASKAQMSYLVDSKLLKGKVSSKVENIEGVKKTLDKALESTGLEASIENNTIIIKKVFPTKRFGNTTLLDEVTVNDGTYSFITSTENTNSYIVPNVSTVTKMDLSPKEIPQTVTVFTRQRIEDQNISNFQELLAKTTGVTLGRYDERIIPNNRGFDVDYYSIDGVIVYPSKYAVSNPDLAIYDRVEVVKGANGLMTGSGEPSLGMNYIRKHANSTKFDSNIILNAGSWKKYGATFDLQSPLNDKKTIRARLIAKHQEQEAFFDKYKKKTDLLYGIINMDLSDSTFAYIGANYDRAKKDSPRWGSLPAFKGVAMLVPHPFYGMIPYYPMPSKTNFDRKTNLTTNWTYWDDTSTSYFANIRQYLYNDISLNLSLTKENIKTDYNLLGIIGFLNEGSNTLSGLQYDYKGKTTTKVDNIDLYSSIPFKVAGLEQEIILGASYNNSKVNPTRYGSDKFVLNTDINKIQENPALAKAPTFNNKTIQTGLYFAGKFSLKEDLKLISGLRVSSWEHKSDNSAVNRKFTGELTPYFGLIYDINEQHSIYASYTSIFQAQDKKDINDNYLDPVEGKSYEAGLKSSYFDNKLNTYVSVFRIKQDGVGQDTGNKHPITGESVFVRSKGVVSKGFEAGIIGNIRDDFTLDLSFVNFEAKDSQGHKFRSENSRTSGSLWAKYNNNDFRTALGISYKSKTSIEVNPNIKPFLGGSNHMISQGAIVTADFMAGYKVNKNFDLQLNINNIFDKKYYDGISNIGYLYAEPRNFNLTMKYTF